MKNSAVCGFWQCRQVRWLAWLFVFVTALAQAQTFSVIHTFTGGNDGGIPGPGLAMDRAGNLYGAAGYGGTHQRGSIFRLTRHGASWIFTPLYQFFAQDGFYTAALAIGPDGVLYGVNSEGGAGGNCGSNGCGTLFKLTPPPTNCPGNACPWRLTVLYRFTGQADGGTPLSLIFDQAGNLYGVAAVGGNLTRQCSSYGCGVVFKFTRSNGIWIESVLYSFVGAPSDGSYPVGNLTFDASGNLFGATRIGGSATSGTIYELSPTPSGWTETILHSFSQYPQTEPHLPEGGLVFDNAGNLYGMTYSGGSATWGTIFATTPPARGSLTTVIHNFDGSFGDAYPDAGLSTDAAGNLYGTTSGYMAQLNGNVFKMAFSSGTWNYTSLHSFTGSSDGAYPEGTVLIDGSGNLYGTTSNGGLQQCEQGCGVIWEITP